MYQVEDLDGNQPAVRNVATCQLFVFVEAAQSRVGMQVSRI
jgi:hypothetical protein